jgi:hypothetical protein
MIAEIGKLARRVLAHVPGTEANARAELAAAKRDLEKRLRADGWSRAAAKVEAAHRLGHHDG